MPDKMYLPSTTSSETEIIGQQDVSSTAVQVTSSPSRNADLESRSGTKGQRRDPFDFNQGCRVKLLMLKKNCSWHFQMMDNHTENILFEHNDLQETVMVSSKQWFIQSGIKKLHTCTTVQASTQYKHAE